MADTLDQLEKFRSFTETLQGARMLSLQIASFCTRGQHRDSVSATPALGEGRDLYTI